MARDTPEIRTAGRSPMRLEPSLSDLAILRQVSLEAAPVNLPSNQVVSQGMSQTDAQHHRLWGSLSSVNSPDGPKHCEPRTLQRVWQRKLRQPFAECDSEGAHFQRYQLRLAFNPDCGEPAVANEPSNHT